MKITHAAKLLAAMALAVAGISFQAQAQSLTNFMVYNFNTGDQVTNVWGNWFGNDFGGVLWDSTVDSSNNPSSGSLRLTVNPNSGFPQFVMYDFNSPTYSGLPLLGAVAFTNLSFDMRYSATSGVRTNGDGTLDFGVLRFGSRGPGFNQDWIYYWQVPATNGAGQPNTNWIHMSIDLSAVPANFPELAGSGLLNTLIAADNGNYNPTLHGQQIIWFDNIQFKGFVAPVPPPTLSIEKAVPALRMFGGTGQFGRAQIQPVDTGESWIGGTFPVTYSFKVLDNATSPGGLDYHIHFIQGLNGYSGADYTDTNVLWLQIISGSGVNPTCVANVSWKTNGQNSNPDQHNVALRITNSVLAGTWTLRFLSNTNGTLTAPGASAVPFSIALDDATVVAAFSPPMQVRFGIQNFGNTANGGIPHDWARITISGTAANQIDEDFTTESTRQLDTILWDLGHSDGTGVINLVPTNAPYWVRWTIPDTGFALTTSTNLNGPWLLPEYYNNYFDGTTTLPTQTTQIGGRWNLILPEYLPTTDGFPGGPISPEAFFRLQNPPPSP